MYNTSILRVSWRRLSCLYPDSRKISEQDGRSLDVTGESGRVSSQSSPDWGRNLPMSSPFRASFQYWVNSDTENRENWYQTNPIPSKCEKSARLWQVSPTGLGKKYRDPGLSCSSILLTSRFAQDK